MNIHNLFSNQSCDKCGSSALVFQMNNDPEQRKVYCSNSVCVNYSKSDHKGDSHIEEISSYQY